MASSKQLKETVNEITECSICTDTMSTPKMLPCLHTFCLKCLEQFLKDKRPRNEASCPLCRSEFLIPDRGLAALQNNIFVQKLLDAQASHEIDQVRRSQTKLIQLKTFDGAKCGQHNKNIDILCIDCQEALCKQCFSEPKHKQHEGNGMKKIVSDIKRSLKSNIEQIEILSQKVKIELENIERLSKDLTWNVQRSEASIINRGEELKLLIDKHVSVLLEKLSVVKTREFKRTEIAKDDLLRHKSCLESYRSYGDEIMKTPMNLEQVYQVCEDFKNRSKYLSNLKINEVGTQIRMTFLPADVEPFTPTRMIGILRIEDERSSSSSTWNIDPTLITHIQTDNFVKGMAILGNELYVTVWNSPKVKIYDTYTYSYQDYLNVPGLSDPCDMTTDGNAIFISECNDGNIYRIQLPDESVSSWSVGCCWNKLSVTDQGSLIVSSNDTDEIFIYSPMGLLQKVIALPDNLSGLFHAVQLSFDRFLIAHENDSIQRVCLIDNKGYVLRYHAGIGVHLKEPRHLVVGRDGLVLVADFENSKIVLLTPELKFIRDIITPSFRLNGIYSFILDEIHGKLYITDFHNFSIAVFQCF